MPRLTETGLVTFPGIDILRPGVYVYTIKEKDAPAGWDMDTREFRLVLHVVDNGRGDLEVTEEYPDGYPDFENAFVGAPTQYKIQLCLNSNLPMPPNFFEIGLCDENGKVIMSIWNQ